MSEKIDLKKSIIYMNTNDRLTCIKNSPLVNKYINEGYVLNKDATRLVKGPLSIIISKV